MFLNFFILLRNFILDHKKTLPWTLDMNIDFNYNQDIPFWQKGYFGNIIHPAGRTLISDWYIDSFTMVVHDNFFLVESMFFCPKHDYKMSNRQPF